MAASAPSLVETDLAVANLTLALGLGAREPECSRSLVLGAQDGLLCNQDGTEIFLYY